MSKVITDVMLFADSEFAKKTKQNKKNPPKPVSGLKPQSYPSTHSLNTY